ncbi:archease [candidate division KSB1 bacterium]|nr:archease [candidate division KSB1 bacterium]RQW00147.1 MAG: archease [candidate division KSB1 bacterium]
METIEFFDHTADIGIRLTRPTPEELFRDAAFAMFDLIAPNNKFRPVINYTITVQGVNLEELMVNWLSEINFYFQVNGYVPVNIALVVNSTCLTAKIQGDIIDRSVHNVEIEIKAITFHKIDVRQADDKWKAQVVFDI